MAKKAPKEESRSSSSNGSDSAPNLNFEGDSSNAYNWRSKFTANVRLSRSKRSPPKQKPRGSQTDTSAEPPSSDSEN